MAAPRIRTLWRTQIGKKAPLNPIFPGFGSRLGTITFINSSMLVPKLYPWLMAFVPVPPPPPPKFRENKRAVLVNSGLNTKEMGEGKKKSQRPPSSWIFHSSQAIPGSACCWAPWEKKTFPEQNPMFSSAPPRKLLQRLLQAWSGSGSSFPVAAPGVILCSYWEPKKSIFGRGGLGNNIHVFFP